MENMPDNVKDNPVGKREALLADRLRLHKGYRYTKWKSSLKAISRSARIGSRAR